MKRYKVINDLQGGTFGMDRNFTLKELREQAIRWANMDEDFALARRLERCEIKNSDLLSFSASWWSLEFAEV